MTQEEKELLIKDLCGRLPYGVMLKHISTEKPFKLFSIKRDEYVSYKKDGVELAVNGVYYDWCVNDIYHNIELYIKPYLRPLSSMTESERKEFDDLSKFDEDVWMGNHKVGFPKNVRIMSKCVDWLDKKMFDHRGLIPKGLALEAPEGMYNN